MKFDSVRFTRTSPFDAELRRRVRRYFAAEGRSTDGGAALVLKSLVLLAWLAASVAAFLVVGGIAAALLCGVSGGLAMGGLGMSVQHDGGHGSYSRHGTVNRLAAAVLDLLGASSFIWRVKHGQLHHTYPNIRGADDDIELAPWLRLAPGQSRRWYHRWQHVYAFGLYAFFGLKWFLWDDFAQLVRGRIGPHVIARPRGGQALLFWAGKVAYLGWAIVLPIALQGVVAGLLFLLASQLTMSVVLSIVFQLAHCVEEADVVDHIAAPHGIALDFATHQLDTTVDFGRKGSWLSWYIGGLDYQAVHHLFPRISHVHYPALSIIVRGTCADYGVRYRASASLIDSLRSHIRWMRQMGAAPTALTGP